MGTLGQIEAYKKHIPKEDECCWIWDGERTYFPPFGNIKVYNTECKSRGYVVPEGICRDCGKKIKVIE